MPTNEHAPIKPKITPIYQTSVFTFTDLTELEAYFDQPGQHYMYSRFGNPNSDELAAEVNKLEKGDGAVVTSSGMSAILTAVLTFCQAGDHMLCAEEIYGGSATLLKQELQRLGIAVTFVPTEQTYDLAAFVQENTRALLAETISNPLLTVLDVTRMAAICRSHNVKLIIDNTFASPVITQPLKLGADLVMHSVTKYLAGHSDVTAGVIVAKGEETAKRIKQIVMYYGLNLSPFDSWLAARGLKTLRLRIKQHSANALEIATFLNQHSKVRRVYYPGLPNHPQNKLAQEQGNGFFGGMLSFQISDELEKVNAFMRALPNIPFAPSLAGVTTSISHPLKTSHRSFSPEQQAKLGITLGLVRLSVGVEEAADLIQELDTALAAL